MRQVENAFRIHRQQSGTSEVGCDWVVGEHELVEVTRIAVEGAVAFHGDDPVGDDEVGADDETDVEDAALDAVPMEGA